jgi:PAS domain S-box-containing protein
MEKLTGRKKKELTEVPVEATYAKEEQPIVRKKLVDETIEKGYMYGFETYFLRPDGTKLPIVANCSLLRDKEGKPSAIIYSAADISELRKREEELTNASSDVTEIMEAISAGDYQKKVSEDYSLPEVVNLTKTMNVVMKYLEKSDEELKAFIKELATPAIEAVEGVVVMPLVGKLTSDRALDAMEVLLNKLEEVRGKAGIIDITGVSGIDSAVADNLIRTMESIKLFGAVPLITGVSGKTAQNLARLGIKFEFITKSTLAEGLRYALHVIRQEEKERGL